MGFRSGTFTDTKVLILLASRPETVDIAVEKLEAPEARAGAEHATLRGL